MKLWKECPHKRKLVYEDKLKGFVGNIYTAFGTAVHLACEKGYTENSDSEERKKIFTKSFEEESDRLGIEKDSDWQKFKDQGLILSSEAVTVTKQYFPDWEVFSAEEKLYESIESENYNFKGFIDLILKKDDKYILIDWKTCSWGWDARRKSDKMTVYQLSYYKNFFAKKYNIDLNNIEITLPVSKKVIGIKLLTGKEEKAIAEDLKASKKIGSMVSPELTTRLRYTIKSIDGDTNQATINNFANNILSRDSLHLRQEMKKVTPDIELIQEVEIGGDTVEVDIPMTVNFFWPGSER